MSKDVKWLTAYTIQMDGIDGHEKFVLASDHDRVVAELKAEVDHLNRQLADAMSGCCDCPMFKAQGKTVAELRAENEILKSKASQFESTLKETMRVRDAEIERLKLKLEDQWKRNGKLVVEIEELKTTVENNRLEHEWPIVKQLTEAETTIAQQELVIEKLREQRNAVIKAANQDGLEYGNPKNWDKELDAIEKGKE